ncbi:MAG: hypothetical protein NWT08_10725 [Akkermansiaceae bacterium]|nr:hypothetical protein [Akkermansiaceae bacterium]MDP4647262.1 hypothetical protein [Akkermansiaceae bacterium]MDP4722512.1 hypothetical protein [Akkermansiaceae bacterium]MDP4781042.1 hypothetical protein [Akkermansiaceae bacterium]MDP4848524.1 hypothetical protein [Akkermansiaceae bacterium]
MRAFADSLANTKSNERPESVEEVAIGDIPGIIELLLQQSGPSGLSWKLRSSIDEMLTKWAKEDFHGALAWATAHPNRNAATDFLETILKEHAAENFDETLAIIASLQNEPGLNLELGSELLETAAKRGAKEAFEVLALFPSNDGSYGGSPTDFPTDFDFQTFAELVSAHMKEHEGSSSPFEHFPTNVYEEWAKVDLQSALQFYLREGELTYGDLGDITKSFLDISEPSSTYPWLSEQYSTLDDESRKRFASGLDSVFPHEMGAKPLIGLLESIPNTALREEMLGHMLEGFGGTTRGDDMTYADLLTVLPTPEKRMEAIKIGTLRYSILRQSDEKLSSLGITREQVEALGRD